MENYIKCIENSVLTDTDIVAFDIGCNISKWDDFTELFLNKYPNSVCYAVEPLHWIEFEKKWKSDNRVFLIKKALSNSIETKKIYVPNTPSLDGLSSFYNRPYFNNQVTTFPVECITLDSLVLKLKLSKIHYLKIDTEGEEFNILKGSVNLLEDKKIEYIQIEYSGTYEDAGYTLSEIETYLNSFGYFIHYVPTNLNYGDILFTHKMKN